EDYAADFGLFVPDAEIDKHLILRRQESTRLDGLWEQACRDLTSKCQMLVLYKEFLDGCRGDLEEEFRIVGQRLHEISWVNPFPLGDSRAPPSTQMRARANIAPESNFRSTLEDATVTLTYLNSDYRKPSSVRCRRKYLKHKLLVIELAAMQAAAEVEARQREVPPTISTAAFYGVVDSLFLGATDLVKTCLIRTRWVVLACCAGSYVLSGMNDWHLEKLGRRVKLEQNCLVRTIWGRQAKLDPRPFRVNKSFTTYPLGVMGHGTHAERTRWDVPRYGINCVQPCCAEDRPQPERNCAAWKTARNRSTTVLRGNRPQPERNRAARSRPQPEHNCCAEYRNQRNRAARNRPQPERNRAARNTARNRAQPCCAEHRPLTERNRAARNIARNPTQPLDICTLKALHTGFKNHPARAQSPRNARKMRFSWATGARGSTFKMGPWDIPQIFLFRLRRMILEGLVQSLLLRIKTHHGTLKVRHIGENVNHASSSPWWA
ncbi:hypothetical protein B0H14DRAFT_2654683, partial [Mycena olivaceomarginata]